MKPNRSTRFVAPLAVAAAMTVPTVPALGATSQGAAVPGAFAQRAPQAKPPAPVLRDYRLRHVATKGYMTPAQAALGADAQVSTWHRPAMPNQVWELERAGTALVADGRKIANGRRALVLRTTYYIHNLSTDRCLQARQGNLAPRERLVISACNNRQIQQWVLPRALGSPRYVQIVPLKRPGLAVTLSSRTGAASSAPGRAYPHLERRHDNLEFAWHLERVS
jgi:hypothetical protein